MQIHQANAKQVSLLYFCDLHIRLIKNTQQINAARAIVYKSLQVCVDLDIKMMIS